MIDPRNPDYQDNPAASRRAVFGYRPGSIPDRPEVSVITPYYNVGPIFLETATSMLNQSLQNWEWLIVNDCSSDMESCAILDMHRNGDPRIRVIDLESNRGLSGARNAGYAEARSDLVFQLDGDDLLEPTALEKFAWFLRTNPEYGMVHSYVVGFENEQYLWDRGFHNGSAVLKENPLVPLVLVRKSVFDDVGGYDESNRGGLEDWEFWIAAADKGHWGATIPEYLSWYRRKPAHGDRWSNWDGGDRQSAFHQCLRKKYTNAFGERFPKVQAKWHVPFEDALIEPAISNPLARDNPRVLMVLPWLRMGGADKWNLDLVTQLRSRGWDVSIVTTLRGEQTWLSEFARHTPDIFVMDRFVRDPDVPAFLRHMIESRRPCLVMVSNSSFGYDIIPFLRSVCPEPAYVDLSHIEEETWHNGGHPRRGVGMQDQLDLNIVISRHLKQWMVARGADPSRIEVSYCNVDHKFWTRNPEVRADVRSELGIGTDEPVILFAGRLCAQKQPNVLAKALLRVAQNGKEFTAVVAGDGPDSPWLRSFVDEHNLAARVKLLGEVSSDRVRDLMSAADIYFLPSSWEGIALSIYEAMSMELAVVGAIVGGQLELVTPDCGILLPKADEDTEIVAYADAIGSLLAEPARTKALGRTARDRIKTRFTLDRMGDRMIELFDQARRLSRAEPRQRLSPGLARELATQAVEFFRVNRLCDELWMQREQGKDERSKLTAQVQGLRRASDSAPCSAQAAQAAQAELAEIEGSKAWRAVLGLKRTPVYWFIARLRYGPDWSHSDPHEHPVAKLARIKNSNAYRCIAKIKSSWTYRFCTSTKHRNAAR